MSKEYQPGKKADPQKANIMPPWTQARIDKAVTLAKNGWKNEAIASALGSSRGAVSVKISAVLGLKRDRPTTDGYRTEVYRNKSATSKFVFDISESDIVPREDRVRFVDLETNACRWPIGGHPAVDPDFGFCGKPQFRGVPGHKVFGRSCYCLDHLKRSINPRYLKQLDEALGTTGETRSP